jgi:hypothetical protein
MKGAFLSTSASRVSAPFFGNIKGGLNEGFYLPEVLQSCLPPLICHHRTRHKYKYIYFPKKVNKKMHIAKKNFPVEGLDTKKAGQMRVMFAKKIHSSLLRWIESHLRDQ